MSKFTLTDIAKIIFDKTLLPRFIFEPVTMNIIDVNKSALVFYQYSREEFLKLKISDLQIAPFYTNLNKLNSINRVNLDKVENTKRDLNLSPDLVLSEQHYLKNGTARQVELYFTTFQTEGIDLVDTTIVDVSAKKINELRLLESNNLLAEANTTLKKVLSTIDDEKNAIRFTVAHNIDLTIRPLLENIRLSCPGRHAECEKTIGILDNLLLAITREALYNSTYLKGKLSNTEFRVCALIHSGYGLKQISTIERVSINTIKTQVKSIRKKIGLKVSDGALKRHLDTLPSLEV